MECGGVGPSGRGFIETSVDAVTGVDQTSLRFKNAPPWKL
eukprot:IDg762t1